MTQTVTKHLLRYCDLCECEMIVCYTCGNNCCNGGSGEVAVNGFMQKCPDCEDAYKMQELHHKNPESIVFGVRRAELGE